MTSNTVWTKNCIKAGLLSLLLLPQISFGFSDFGHRLICAAAYELVEPKTQRFIDQVMMKAKVSDADSFAQGCTWPDSVRRTTHRETDQYHYMNVPRGEAFDHDRDCAAYDCVTQAIQRYALDLSDRTNSWRNRKEALFFLGHFVADLHQPLHVGYAEDRGGNRIQVYKFSRAKHADVNLHWLWDKAVPYKAGLGQSGAKQTLLKAISEAQVTEWQNNAVVDWARQSHCLAKRYVYQMPDGTLVKDKIRLNSDYYARATPIIYQQFMRATVRLAWLLDQAALGTVSFERQSAIRSAMAC